MDYFDASFAPLFALCMALWNFSDSRDVPKPTFLDPAHLPGGHRLLNKNKCLSINQSINQKSIRRSIKRKCKSIYFAMITSSSKIFSIYACTYICNWSCAIIISEYPVLFLLVSSISRGYIYRNIARSWRGPVKNAFRSSSEPTGNRENRAFFLSFSFLLFFFS